jgi:transposase-like protein
MVMLKSRESDVERKSMVRNGGALSKQLRHLLQKYSVRQGGKIVIPIAMKYVNINEMLKSRESEVERKSMVRNGGALSKQLRHLLQEHSVRQGGKIVIPIAMKYVNINEMLKSREIDVERKSMVTKGGALSGQLKHLLQEHSVRQGGKMEYLLQ